MPSNVEKLFYDLLGGIREGCLIVRDPQGRKRTFGTEGTTPTARLLVHNGDLYSRLLRDADLGLGESYMDGWWDEENDRIVDLMAIILNNGIKEKVRRDLHLKTRFLYRWLLTLPTLSTSRKNAQFHYDLGNDFFEHFLDPSMTYSCGYQHRSEDTLHRMQMQKYELICRKLALQPGDRLIDIGCGWGGMLVYAAKEYGVSGLGVTLSPQQQAWSQRRIEEEGLSGRLEVRLQDYREVEGTFDKFVSIGMFEHVGKEYYGTFMRKVYNLLKPGGIGLLHTIGSTGSRFPGDWIRTYIFPGTRLPRLGDLTEEMRQGGLTVGHIENWKLHYAETARHWKENFHANREKIAALDGHYDERFLRMWDYYLQLLEGCFRYDTLQLYQVLFCQGRRWTLPLCFNFHDADAGAIAAER
jgi:cyclopropane-fatty-acyl-phospholipid synthase